MTTTPSATVSDSDAPTSPGDEGLGVLVADKFDASGHEALRALGCRVESDPGLAGDTLTAAIARVDPDVLIVRGTRVEAASIQAAKKLSLIVRAGAGYDSIDVAEASARGIFVANCPGKNAIAVAELTWSLILSCDRRVPDQVADLRAGKWNKKEYGKAAGLYGRTLGIVGLGLIGREVAHRAKAFGMHVVGWSRSLDEETADAIGVGYCSNLINLAKVADVVSIHVAATGETSGLIGKKFFAGLKPGATLVNTSRGSVVDESALRDAVREKGIRVGLDVYASEPGAPVADATFPIAAEPGVYGTHHVGASTDQAQHAIADETVRIVTAYQISGEVPNCVNRALTTPATNLLTVRHLNHPGVLAHVFYTLGQSGINVEEMENIIYDGARAACARIQLDDTPSVEHLNAIRNNDDVLSVTLARIPAPE